MLAKGCLTRQSFASRGIPACFQGSDPVRGLTPSRATAATTGVRPRMGSAPFKDQHMPDHHRIFFALWPSAEDAARLMGWAHAAQAVCGGRMNRRENLHMTLAYLGETEHERVEELLAAAD